MLLNSPAEACFPTSIIFPISSAITVKRENNIQLAFLGLCGFCILIQWVIKQLPLHQLPLWWASLGHDSPRPLPFSVLFETSSGLSPPLPPCPTGTHSAWLLMGAFLKHYPGGGGGGGGHSVSMVPLRNEVTSPCLFEQGHVENGAPN